jgi:hypothetical protein
MIEKGAIELLGNSEFSLRLAPLVVGIASLFLFKAVAQRVLKPGSTVLALGLFDNTPSMWVAPSDRFCSDFGSLKTDDSPLRKLASSPQSGVSWSGYRTPQCFALVALASRPLWSLGFGGGSQEIWFDCFYPWRFGEVVS